MQWHSATKGVRWLPPPACVSIRPPMPLGWGGVIKALLYIALQGAHVDPTFMPSDRVGHHIRAIHSWWVKPQRVLNLQPQAPASQAMVLQTLHPLQPFGARRTSAEAR